MKTTSNDPACFPFENSYASLPERFYVRVHPTPVPNPALIRINRGLAEHLGLDPDYLASPGGVEIISGNRVPPGAEPLAMAYAGQQFGRLVPRLGDGRALLLGEVIDACGRRRDIQLKGSGRTPFSRSGDGRAWIGPVLREYLVSEAMAALNIPTTRALAAISTGELILRDRGLPGAIIARVAASHIRVGTFQYFALRKDVQALKILADHVIDRHFPDAREATNPYLCLLEYVVAKQAALIAKWMAVGFIHGVMNTDNVLVSGETIDYGPCAFMDGYDPAAVYSSIDLRGRYAYQNQPSIARWNLASFATTLLPLLDSDIDRAVEAAESVVNAFGRQFNLAWSAEFRAKMGLAEEKDGDAELAQDLLERMAANHADFTLTFRRLGNLSGTEDGTHPKADSAVAGLFDDAASIREWLGKWRARLASEKQGDLARQSAMRATNPAYIPRNHRIEQVISAALAGDFGPFGKLADILSKPFDEQPENAGYQLPPGPEEVVHTTFCGT
ncbi:MAG: YdiU family protein [Alphaproteobacteria bacterium]|nr:YdiU family protein [Alphaproteobacteria bacterium]